VSGRCGEDASAQPHPHNPRKQRKNPAAAGSGERFREGKWRSGSPPIHVPHRSGPSRHVFDKIRILSVIIPLFSGLFL
jgi:hypothetical protein